MNRRHNDGFCDRGERFNYLIACENARRIIADPGLLDVAAEHLGRFAAGDPHQKTRYDLWVALLSQGPAAVAERLTEKSREGTTPARPRRRLAGSRPACGQTRYGRGAKPDSQVTDHRMPDPRKTLRQADIHHILRAAAAITTETSFMLIGTAAAIVQLKHVPFALMRTREADVCAPAAVHLGTVSDLIDGSIGEGSQFDLTFGYDMTGGRYAAAIEHDMAPSDSTLQEGQTVDALVGPPHTAGTSIEGGRSW